MTLPEIADRINALFRKYGLDHDVVHIVSYDPPPQHRHQLDPRENEPDVMKWRVRPELALTQIAIIDGEDPGKMALLLTTLDYVFATFFDVHPESNQLRLF